MRKLLSSFILLMPFVAAGQSLDGIPPATAANKHMATYRSSLQPVGQENMPLPLWRDADGRRLELVGIADVAVPGVLGVGVSQGYGSGLHYDIGPHVAAYAQMAQRTWLTPTRICTPSDGVGCPDVGTLGASLLLSGRVGASYSGSEYRFDVLFERSHRRGNTSLLLPRVLPQSSTTVVPLWSLDSNTSFSARGRLALGYQTDINLGASVGRIRLLPGNLLGVHAFGQQSLSLGVDSGSLSGRITGRMLQPVLAGSEVSSLSPERHWTTIDLGVTWRLPWQGELRFGAQNLWSSGQVPTPAEGPTPNQSRIPYVQYHQDL